MKQQIEQQGMEDKTENQKAEERVVRILSTDIEGNMTIYSGLTKIRGISWAFANAVCRAMNLDKRKKIGSLSKEDIKKIEEFAKNPKVAFHIFNRRRDFETGENRHLVGSELELRKEFDIKRLKKIKSYRGIRHVAGLPLRGQRTRSHFRANRKKGVGIKKKTVKREAPPQRGGRKK